MSAPIVVAGITLDFGNTLVRVPVGSTRRVMAIAAEEVAGRWRLDDLGAFLDAWSEETARQFREEVPLLREVDLPERLVRTLARLRGMRPPPPDERWDDRAAARYSDPAEVADGIAAYERAFVATMQPIDGVGEAIARLHARGFTLGILSNWPLASVIDRYAEARGWAPHLRAIVVSKRVGAIKPDRRIFDAAADALGLAPRDILHVGDDWEADVVGGRRAGFRVAYLRDRQHDTPLPTSRPAAGVAADLEADSLEEVEAAVRPPSP